MGVGWPFLEVSNDACPLLEAIRKLVLCALMGLVLELATTAVGEIGGGDKSDSDILKMIFLSHTFYLSIYQTDGFGRGPPQTLEVRWEDEQLMAPQDVLNHNSAFPQTL